VAQGVEHWPSVEALSSEQKQHQQKTVLTELSGRKGKQQLTCAMVLESQELVSVPQGSSGEAKF
jgi:hypothetical protein